MGAPFVITQIGVYRDHNTTIRNWTFQNMVSKLRDSSSVHRKSKQKDFYLASPEYIEYKKNLATEGRCCAIIGEEPRIWLDFFRGLVSFVCWDRESEGQNYRWEPETGDTTVSMPCRCHSPIPPLPLQEPSGHLKKMICLVGMGWFLI